MLIFQELFQHCHQLLLLPLSLCLLSFSSNRNIKPSFQVQHGL
jgi:hypothetical protein